MSDIQQTLERITALNARFLAKGEQLSRAAFVKLGDLGAGSSAAVYRVRSITTRTEYAIKAISFSNVFDVETLNRELEEVALHSLLEHDNVIKMIAVWSEESDVCVVLELALFSLEAKLLNEGSVSSREAAAVLSDLVDALRYLGALTPPIIHRDIKPANVLFSNGRYKLADFGSAAALRGPRSSLCGTLEYFAPEMIAGGEHGAAIDVWALGVLLYELVEGAPPFRPIHIYGNSALMEKLTKDSIQRGTLTFSPQTDETVRKTIELFLKIAPSERPSLSDLPNCPLLAEHKTYIADRRRRLQSPKAEQSAIASPPIRCSALFLGLQLQHLTAEKKRLQELSDRLARERRNDNLLRRSSERNAKEFQSELSALRGEANDFGISNCRREVAEHAKALRGKSQSNASTNGARSANNQFCKASKESAPRSTLKFGFKGALTIPSIGSPNRQSAHRRAATISWTRKAISGLKSETTARFAGENSPLQRVFAESANSLSKKYK